MLYVKLKSLRLLTEEIGRLEKMKKRMAKSRDPKEQKAYDDYLKQCRKARDLLRSKKLLDKVPLSKEERKMAESFYYNGKKWEDAAWDAIDTLSPTKQKSFETGDDENIKQYIWKQKKAIERKIKDTFIDIEDKKS